jgi:hypothetical protein
VVPDDGGDLAGDVGRTEAGRVRLDVHGGAAAQRQCVAQLLGGLGRAEGQHGGSAAGGVGKPHGELHGALLVGADREADVAAVDRLAVLSEQDLAGGVGHPLDADEHLQPVTRAGPLRRLGHLRLR